MLLFGAFAGFVLGALGGACVAFLVSPHRAPLFAVIGTYIGTALGSMIVYDCEHARHLGNHETWVEAQGMKRNKEVSAYASSAGLLPGRPGADEFIRSQSAWVPADRPGMPPGEASGTTCRTL